MAKKITLEHKDFTECAWKILLDKLGISENDRKNWIDSIEVGVSDAPASLAYADTKYSIAEVKELANRYFKGGFINVEYRWGAWYLTHSNSSTRYTDTELDKLKNWLDKKENAV